MAYRIGGMFPLQQAGAQEIGYFLGRGDDLRFAQSGRCALYACLQEIGLTDSKRVAYVPAYTCETVLSSYVKAGYTLRFYDVGPESLVPRFSTEELGQISVLGLCAYYGFSTYDRAFVRKCRQRGITVLQDITHSPFSQDGYCPDADYYAGSLRKWMGIACGGVAIKRVGRFALPWNGPDEGHLEGRYRAMELRAQALETGDESFDRQAYALFWETEMLLRKTFDSRYGDQVSSRILRTLEPSGIIAARRRNYRTILEKLVPSAQCMPVFPVLDDASCPSHFTFYSEDRERAVEDLAKKGILATVYWPLPPMVDRIADYPGSRYVYDHICSVQVDQRYRNDEMEYLAQVLSSLR